MPVGRARPCDSSADSDYISVHEPVGRHCGPRNMWWLERVICAVMSPARRQMQARSGLQMFAERNIDFVFDA